MKRSMTFFACAMLSLAFALRASATIQDPVQVEQGKLSGAPGRNPGVKVYRGIPYAAPPVGDLRWKPPQPAAHWSGVRQATAFGNDCIQPPPPPGSPELFKTPFATTASKSEDCLYLNIWTPANLPADKLPVMFWIHAGGFVSGAGSYAAYEGENLARKGVVVVSINYRLGVFGFFALPELTAESPHHASGNYGLMDQIAALQWVNKNITAFGGDPKNVTIFGESSGSWAVNLLAASPLAKGLFERGIGESGACFVDPDFHPMMTRVDAEQAGEKLASGMGVMKDVLKTLRAQSAENLVKATADSYRLAFAVVDGWVLPEDVETIYGRGEQNDIPIIVGNNANELTIFMPPVSSAAQFIADVKKRYGAMANGLLKAYPADSDAQATESAYALSRDEFVGWGMREWARIQTKTGHHAVYRYYFSHHPPGPDGQRLGAFHGLELDYVFGNFTYPFTWNDTDRKLSQVMMSYWTNFAKTGDPNGPGLPKWPVYNATDDNVLDIGDPVTVRTHVNEAGLDFLDAYHAHLAAAAIPEAPSGKALLEAYVSAWNHHDLAALDKMLAPDAVHEDLAAGVHAQGIAQVKDFMEKLIQGQPDLDWRLTTVVESGPVVAAEWTWTATLTGDVPTRLKGQRISGRGASVAVIENGKITRFTDYYDIASMLPKAPNGPANSRK